MSTSFKDIKVINKPRVVGFRKLLQHAAAKKRRDWYLKKSKNKQWMNKRNAAARAYYKKNSAALKAYHSAWNKEYRQLVRSGKIHPAGNKFAKGLVKSIKLGGFKGAHSLHKTLTKRGASRHNARGPGGKFAPRRGPKL